SAAEKAIERAKKCLDQGNKEFRDYNFKRAISFYDIGIKERCRNKKINEDLQKKKAEAKSVIDFIESGCVDKAIERAKEFLEQGHKEFLDHNFKKAISLYDKGIEEKCCDEEINKDLQKKKAEAKSVIDFIDKKKVIEGLLFSGVNGEEWPRCTWLIVVIKDKKEEIIFDKVYESKGRHAECNMLEDPDFKEVLGRDSQDLTITLTINYSPCYDCAVKLEEFRKEHKAKMNLLIRFSHPYYIYENENKKGLQKLYKAGVTLEAMSKKSWLDILVWLFRDKFNPERVRQRDKETSEKLKEVLKKEKEKDVKKKKKEKEGGKEEGVQGRFEKMSMKRKP
ncbi:uncharacterized protein LOC111335748, partial [Stylophora pistillata]|uniref:uncharacterized protein LOC111335748 n=1 Tax=Stylophora pistillata TaxID=50429 RepID=UPI000C040A00